MSLTLMEALPVGSLAPDVALQTEGVMQSIQSLRGEPAIIVFLAEHWDPAQDQLLDTCQRILQSAGSDGKLVRISVGANQCELDFEDKSSFQFPIVGNLGAEAAASFGVAGKQAIFVLDQNGRICWSYISDGGGGPDFNKLVAAVDRTTGKPQVTRRELLAVGMAATLCLVLPNFGFASTIARRADRAKTRTTALTVNGKPYELQIDGGLSLLDALREKIGLMGTKKGCDHGQCGACTVHVDGRRVNSCLTLAAQVEGTRITTIEGLASNGQLNAVQQAFISHDGLQCGFCTSGQIMSAMACIKEGHTSNEQEIKEWMSGNICRCGAYPGICAAIQEAKNYS